MDKSCTLEVNELKCLLVTPYILVYYYLLPLSFIMAGKVFFVLQIYLQLFIHQHLETPVYS